MWRDGCRGGGPWGAGQPRGALGSRGEGAADGDAQARAGAAAGLFRDLEGDPIEPHDVILAHGALFFMAENLVEVHRAQRHEGAGGIGRGSGEGFVIRLDEVLAEIRVGGRKRGDACHAEFIDEAVLEGAVEALTAAAGLGE